MAGRKLEHAVSTAGAGEKRNLPAQLQLDLAGKLHGCGQDMMVIADAIAALTKGPTS